LRFSSTNSLYENKRGDFVSSFFFFKYKNGLNDVFFLIVISFNSPQGLESSTIGYSLSEDLYQIVKTLLRDPDIVFEMKEKAFENTKKYTSANFNK
jgi:hypothetical protein